jgi:hypothetical protein
MPFFIDSQLLQSPHPGYEGQPHTSWLTTQLDGLVLITEYV